MICVLRERVLLEYEEGIRLISEFLDSDWACLRINVADHLIGTAIYSALFFAIAQLFQIATTTPTVNLM